MIGEEDIIASARKVWTIDEAQLEKIPATLPLRVVSLFHNCQLSKRAHMMTSAFMAKKGATEIEHKDPTMGEMEQLKERLTTAPSAMLNLLQFLQQETGAPFPGNLADAPTEQLATHYVLFITHELHIISKLGLKQLYGGIITDIWEEVARAHAAAEHLRDWNEPDAGLESGHVSLLDLHADGGRAEDDTEYWRKKMIEAIGCRTMYRAAVMPTINAVRDRIAEERRREAEEQLGGLSQLFDALGGKLPSSGGAGGPPAGGLADLIKKIGGVAIPIGAPFDDSKQH